MAVVRMNEDLGYRKIFFQHMIRNTKKTTTANSKRDGFEF